MTDTQSNPWELYSNHPQFEAATRDMNESIMFAAKLPSWDIARAYMRAAQKRWRDVGADDSEPRNHIVECLNMIFAEAVNPYSRRGNGLSYGWRGADYVDGS